jgi:hypothetical protein
VAGHLLRRRRRLAAELLRERDAIRFHRRVGVIGAELDHAAISGNWRHQQVNQEHVWPPRSIAS